MFDAMMFDPEPQATCIGCGCTDDFACECGCYWLTVDRKLEIGVCSSCPGSRPKFIELLATGKAKSEKKLAQSARRISTSMAGNKQIAVSTQPSVAGRRISADTPRRAALTITKP